MTYRDAEYREPNREVELVAHRVIGAAIEVHRVLGPGFLEGIYEEALCVELTRRAIPFARQVQLLVDYKGSAVGELRLDLLVSDSLIVELKAADSLAPVHVAQVLSYLKATNLNLGLLINFNLETLRQGIKRIVRSC